MMAKEDKFKIAKRIVKIVNGKVPIMGNIIANSYSEGTRELKAYEASGVDAIGVTPPLIYKYTNEGLVNYFTFLAKNTLLPIYIYNAPESGNKLSPELIIKLADENENIVGCKDSTQNIVEQQILIDGVKDMDKFELIAGSDAQIVSTMMLGGTGVISLISTLFPSLVVDTCEACRTECWKKAMALQQKILRVRSILKTGPFMAAYKAVSHYTGQSFGCMKKPLAEVSEDEKDKIIEALKKEGIL
ncbi:MAG: dihydrodipicolinate synthase family protein [Eubacterium sp.]